MKTIIRGFCALALCSMLMCCNFTSSEGYRKAANKLERQKRYSEAIQLLDKAVEDDPDNINAFLDRGVDKSIIKDIKGSIDDYTKVIAIDPTNGLALLNRGKSRAQSGDYRGAIIDFDKAIAFKTHRPFDRDEYDVKIEAIRLERGIAFYQMDSLSRAFADLTFAIEHFCSLPESYYLRGMIYLKYNMKEEACKDFVNARNMGNPFADKLIGQYCR
jgi:tetratricopeptide (TPR) repeat protein